MVVLKCKMCGGDLSFENGATVVECEYRGTKPTVPTVNDEKKITLSAARTAFALPVSLTRRRAYTKALSPTFPRKPRCIGVWCFANTA